MQSHWRVGGGMKRRCRLDVGSGSFSEVSVGLGILPKARNITCSYIFRNSSHANNSITRPPHPSISSRWRRTRSAQSTATPSPPPSPSPLPAPASTMSRVALAPSSSIAYEECLIKLSMKAPISLFLGCRKPSPSMSAPSREISALPPAARTCRW